MPRLFAAAAAASALLAISYTLSPAQEAYPSRPITMVVPFPPGGVADSVPADGRRPGEDPQAAGRRHEQAGAGGAVGMAQSRTRSPTATRS